MAVNIEDLTNFLGDIFNNEQSQEAFQEDPEGFLNQNGFGNVSAFEVEQAANRVFAPDQGATTAASASAGPALVHPLPSHEALVDDPGQGGLAAAIDAVSYYQNVYNTTYDNDQAFDTSTNNNITAFGDVDLDQDIDTNIASGDGAVAGVEDSQVQTGDGIQAGDDIEDSNLVQGDVEDSVLAQDIDDSAVVAGSTVGGSVIGGSDIDDSLIGDGNTAIVGSDLDDSAVAFGDGDATNVQADNANVGDGNVLVDGDIEGNANIGDGTQTNIENSDVSETAFGGGDVTSNDTTIDADDGSAVSLGGDASASDNDVDIDDSYVGGNVQNAGNDATQVVDQSADYDDSFNTDDSFNQDQSVDVDDSAFTDVDQAGDDIDDAVLD